MDSVKYLGVLLVLLGAFCMVMAGVIYIFFFAEGYDKRKSRIGIFKLIHPKVQAVFDRNYLEGEGNLAVKSILKWLRFAFYFGITGAFFSIIIGVVTKI